MAAIEDQDHFDIPDELPVLPIRDLVVFPYMIVPLFVSRDISVAAIDEALARDRLILLVTQKEPTDDKPGREGVFELGTVGMVMRMRKLPDGRIKVLVQGLVKARLKEITREQPAYAGRIERVPDPPLHEIDLETEALMRSVKESLEKLIAVGKALSPDVMLVLQGIADPGRLADLCAANLGLKPPQAQALLEEMDPIKRLRAINDHLAKEAEVLAMQARIQSQAKEEMTKTQREYFLREQLRQIQQELGETEQEEIRDLRERIAKSGMTAEVRAEAEKQARRLESMHADSAEAGVLRTYVETLCELPWTHVAPAEVDLSRARKVLDEDHYDLEEVKERIVEFLAVSKLKKDSKGPILCFAGPPGVGKTSLGKSIARALGRNFVRVSLGGIHDEAEIRGHRRTYVGAMPGRIMQGIRQAGTTSPVFMLDEIDKLSNDFRGDPSAAMLEVLDPEQNHAFRDHYLGVPYDLSHVLWIATANLVDPIPPALRDRMEVIGLAGYSEEEKLHIAKKYIVPKQVAENGLKGGQFAIADGALTRLVRGYTREAGLRNLEREVARVCRKVARRVAEGEVTSTVVGAKDVEGYLGPVKFLPETAESEDAIGECTGLAWTPYGGEILKIEVAGMRSGKAALILTGQLGEVMKESAMAALTWVRAHAEELGAPADFFAQHEIHVHVPAGGIPKDGPSAGVAVCTALASLCSQQPVRKDVAMTGEITLRGRVLPIGGLKEKLLAAVRAGMKTVVIPKQNQKDLAEIPAHVLRKVKVVPASQVTEVLAAALLGRPAVRRPRAVR